MLEAPSGSNEGPIRLPGETDSPKCPIHTFIRAGGNAPKRIE
jgi:hypothetical protein